jgi:hypothetical protein
MSPNLSTTAEGATEDLIVTKIEMLAHIRGVKCTDASNFSGLFSSTGTSALRVVEYEK